MATKAALCVVDVNKAAGTVKVYSPAGGTAVLYPQHLPLALAARLVVAGRGPSSARVGASRVFPVILTYAEMVSVKLAELRTNEDIEVAAAHNEASDWDIEAERLASCA